MNDIANTDGTLEHRWTEVQSKNKRSPKLISIVY